MFYVSHVKKMSRQCPEKLPPLGRPIFMGQFFSVSSKTHLSCWLYFEKQGRHYRFWMFHHHIDRRLLGWMDGPRGFNKSLFWALSDKPFSPLDRHIDKCDTPRRALNYLAIDTSKQAMSATSHLKVEHNNVNYILGRIPYSCTLLAPKNGLSPRFWRLN